jgi:hypothetical protein
MQEFRSNRISPYDPMRYHPIRVRFENGAVSLDTEDFDRAAARYLDEFGFTSFRLGFDPPGRFDEESRATLGAVLRAQVEHLRSRGWLEKAYAYWIDEPAPDQYEHARTGMEFLAEVAPGLKRLLTFDREYAPVEYFEGAVDIWCIQTRFFHPGRARARRAAGEEIWTYVCTNPRRDFANNFIDEPGVDHRARFWTLWAFGVDGDLYWSTTYWWNKNPWEDPMSYVHGNPQGRWGNGDGYLLYPPSRERPSEPLVAPPNRSVRWELIRKGLEDIELLRMLESRAPEDPLLAEIRRAYGSWRQFARDPEVLADLRRRVCRRLEGYGR